MVAVEQERGPNGPLQELAEHEQDLPVGFELVETLLRFFLVLVLRLFFRELVFLVWVVALLCLQIRETGMLLADNLLGSPLCLSKHQFTLV